MSLPSPEVTPRPRPRAEIERALTAFGLALHSAEYLAESVLNENYRVETSGGPRFLRFIRETRTAERILLGYRMMSRAAEAGVPLPLPVLVAGRPLVRTAGRLVQLFPWVDGRHAGHAEGDAEAMGICQAALHVALAGFTDPELAAGGTGTAWDTGAAIALLSRVDDLIRYYPSPPPDQLAIQETVRAQLQRLEGGEARPPSDFAGLPVQPCHGDYHNRNVMLGATGEVLAVVDWEMPTIIPPVYELIRAIAFSGYLEPPYLDGYLRGYASVRRLHPEECALGVEMWWQSRLHDTWSLRQRFIRGERGVERFFPTEAALLRRFSDPGYRSSLTERMLNLAT